MRGEILVKMSTFMAMEKQQNGIHHEGLNPLVFIGPGPNHINGLSLFLKQNSVSDFTKVPLPVQDSSCCRGSSFGQ